MKITSVVLGITLTYLSAVCALAQSPELKFHLIEDPNGKPLGKIRDITQDRNGYMWFAGESARCIYRYDGTRLTSFSHDDADPNSLGSNQINSICADSSGFIWISHGSGLDQFNPATGIFKHYRHSVNDPGSLMRGSIEKVLRDRHGRLWIGGHGLDRFDENTGKFTHYRHDPNNKQSLSSDIVWNLYEDRQGVLWVACGKAFYNEGKDWDDGGLNRLEPDGTFTQFKHSPDDPHSLISNKVRAMFEDSRGNFWVGTSGDGLHILDRKTGLFQRYPYDPNHPEKLSRPALDKHEFAFNNDQITFITEDTVGSIWIGTMWGGINRYDTLTKKITHLKNSHGFPDASAWNAFQSREGVLWITTEENHLYRVDLFRYDIPEIATGPVTRILEDNDGSLWLGSESGLLEYDQQKRLIHQYKHDAADTTTLSNDNVTLLFQNQTDSLWVGTQGGLDIFNKKTATFHHIPLPITEKLKGTRNKLQKIVQQKEFKWLTTWGNGLFRYNTKDGTLKHFLVNPVDTAALRDKGDLTANHLGAMLVDSVGNLWIGSAKGILRFDPKTEKFTHYLEDLITTYLYKDSRDTLWAGTIKGLYRYSKTDDTFLPLFESQSGLSNDIIFGITEDASKNLWISTTDQIVRIDAGRNNQFVYGKRYGVTSPAFSVIYTMRRGEILVGSQGAMYHFFPETLNSKTPFDVHVSSLSINRTPVLVGEGSPIKTAVEEVTSLALAYNQNNFSINFAAPDYRAPESIRYFVTLEGYDSWHPVEGEKRSDYFSVPNGTYRYKVRAYNIDGRKAETEITITISPPWWKTWWAYSGYGIVGLLLLFSLYHQQAQRIVNREKQKSQLKELEQAKEIQRAYDDLRAAQGLLIQSEKMASLGELTAGIAHEIQNPLNFVNNFSDINTELVNEMKAALMEGKSDEVFALADDIIKNEQKINYHGKRADAIVKGMLLHTRISSGIKDPTNINQLIDEYLRLAYHGLRAKDKSFNATLKTDFDESIGSVNLISQDIGRVILNLFTNAFYSVAEKKKKIGDGFEPSVAVSTRKYGSTVEIRVKDNGFGVAAPLKDKIFQPFFTTKPTGEGTGLGLSLSYDIIKAHSGEFILGTIEGEYAEFIIRLPI